MNWKETLRLLRGIRADGYDVDSVETDTSLATVDDKRIEICVSRTEKGEEETEP